jgi:hypothetical protein
MQPGSRSERNQKEEHSSWTGQMAGRQDAVMVEYRKWKDLAQDFMNNHDCDP